MADPLSASADPISASDVSGLVLAGGRSRRFGEDKARFAVEGRPMARRVYDALVPLVGEVFVSVRVPGANPSLPAEEVVDRYSDAGPLAGLHAGLVRCETPWLLAVACDLPFVTTEALASVLTASRAPIRPVVPRTPDGRLQPLCALYPVALVPLVEKLLRGGRYAMHGLLEAVGDWDEVALPQAPLRNVNTRSDLGSPR